MPAAATKASLKRTGERLLKRANAAAEKNPSVTFTPEALKRLQELEDQAQQEAQSNPDLKLQFSTVTDFLAQWAALNPDQQKKLGEQFQERANALVDVPFNQQLTDLRGSLTTQLKDLNQKYQFLTQDEELKLGNQLKDLDADTTKQLTDAFNSIEGRGLGNSGLMRAAADAIMNGKAQAVASAQEAASLDKNQGLQVLQAGIEKANADSVIKERGIKQEQTVAREVKKNDLVSRSLQTDLLQQIISGATELTPRDLSTFQPSALNPDSLPTPDSVATTPAANIPPAQRIRDVRLGISGATAPTPVAPVTPATPTPAAPIQTPTRNVSTAGMTADQRRTIRLNRINSGF